MSAEDTCRLAAELHEEYGELAFGVSARAIAIFMAEGLEERAVVWRALHAVLEDIRASRLDPYAPITLH